MSIQRWDFHDGGMETWAEGEWVLYADHAAEVERLRTMAVSVLAAIGGELP